MSGSGVMESTGQTLSSAHPVEQEGVAHYRLRDTLSTCIANSFAQCRSTCRFIFAHYSAWLLQSLVSYSPKQTSGAAQHLPHHVLIHTVALCL